MTNGPLLRCRADGQLPGHLFVAPEGGELSVEVTVRFSSPEPVRAIEIVKDGKLERAVPAEMATRTGSLGRVTFKESGWFLIRAIVEHPKTFRFAQTAPYYVEIGRKNRLSRAAAEFFRDWAVERSEQLTRLESSSQRREILEQWDRARKFWEERVANANAP